MSFYLKQIISKLTPSAKKHLDMAINLAVSRRHYEVDIIHLIYVIISNDENLIEQLAKETLLNPPSIINAIEKEFMELPQGDVNTQFFQRLLFLLLKSLGYMPLQNGLAHLLIHQPYLLLYYIQKENYFQNMFLIV
ncbi:hypothetical protein NBY12_24500 (plasmid) [Escherichia coli]|uniref:hypothetical protein n=1 Tax=Escherichia coli TaxID=562 RepID=UPI00202EBC16|nr:hypothetical protein [Escherichia coli]URV23167.1 hypothetical protein NBY12_24500 [Escherichia coli]